MTYNLTEKQKELARWIVARIRDQTILESFVFRPGGVYVTSPAPGSPRNIANPDIHIGTLSALEEAKLVLIERQEGTKHVCTASVQLFSAVDTNFAEKEVASPLSTLAHATPPELNLSLDRLRKKYPDPAKLGFLVMRFVSGKAFGEIVTAIQETAVKHGIAIIRADEHEFHADLWGNVRTFLHGCSFGVAVYERIEQEEPNANVGLEIGYLLAMNKPVLLLKERTVKTLQADLMGRLYKEFDEHDPAGTIPEQLERWLTDNGVIVPVGG